MTKEEILNNIKSNNKKQLILFTLPAIILNFFTLGIFVNIVNGNAFAESEVPIIFPILFCIFIIFMTIGVDIGIATSIKLIMNPLEADVFKKYGSVKKIEKILDEIEQTIEYDDNNIVISKNYIFNRRDISKLVNCKDVLEIHKLVHKTNLITDSYSVVITDKYNEKMVYSYVPKEEKRVNTILLQLKQKCPNAVLGYTPEETENIIRNQVELPKENPNIQVKEKLNSKDSKYDDLLKLKKLLDEGILTEKEFNIEKQKILNNSK